MVHTPTSDKTALSTVAPAGGRPCCVTCDTRLFFIYKRLRSFLCLIAHDCFFFNTLRQLLSKPSLFSKVAGFRCPRRDAVGLNVHKSLKNSILLPPPPHFSRALSSKSRFLTARQEPTDRWDDVPRSGRFQGVYALASRVGLDARVRSGIYALMGLYHESPFPLTFVGAVIGLVLFRPLPNNGDAFLICITPHVPA